MNRINLKDYKNVKKPLLEMYEKHGLQRALEMCTYTFIPLIVCYSFLQKEYGGFEEDIERLTEFYRYDEILEESNNDEIIGE